MRASYQSHTANYPDVMEPTTQFGVLTIQTDPVPITKRRVAFVFNIDRSDSMNELIRGKTKLEFVKETMTRMCEYLTTLDCTVFAEINSFNHTFTTDYPLAQVNVANIKSLLDKIGAIQAEGYTDIGTAFKTVDQRIQQIQQTDPNTEIVHVFLSDGEATEGITSQKKLRSLINQSYSNIMIGYGIEHHAALMHSCAVGGKHSVYLFVNDFEQTYGVYSEILNTVLYPATQDVEITVEGGGEVYDGTTGRWESRLSVPILSGDVTVTYYTRHHADAANIKIQYVFDNQASELVPTSVEGADLTHHIYRQLTQYMIYKSSNIALRDEVYSLFQSMKAYIGQDEEHDTMFMRRLCDDLNMVYNTMGDSHDGNTYRISLLNSQTRYVSYRISDDIDIGTQTQNEMTLGDAPHLDYRSSHTNYTLEYATPSLRKIQNSLTPKII
jgi:hypothetical protein